MATSDRLLSPGHFDIDRLEVAANDNDGHEPDLLFTVVEELLRCGSNELHLEQEANFCRMRHRVNGQLTESRIQRADMVDAVLTRLRLASRQQQPSECASFRISADNIDPLATIDAVYYQAAAGPCLTLTEYQVLKRVPRVVQISPLLYADSSAMIGNAVHNTDKAYCDWQSNQSGSFYAEQLWQQNVPLVSFHLARNCGAAMRDIINCAIDRQILATRLQKVINVRQVSTLCPHCADSHQPGPLQQEWLSSIAPADQSDVYFNTLGCSRCEYTGAAGKLTLIEIADCNDAMVAAIESRSANGFQEGFSKNIQCSIALQAQSAAHAGDLSFDQYKQLIDSL